MATPLQRLVTGIKPTGEIHLGNYFAVMRPLVALQEQCEAFVFVADYHALNQIQHGEVLMANSLEITKAYLAIGLDPEKVTLFRQSDVPEHAELTWIFNTITPMAMLELAHAYKDALQNGKLANVGLSDYPVLMAADILLYDPHIVPVGSDQRQHVEIAREIARKFNNLFGQTFREPQEKIQEDVAVVPGTDGRKMSKSYQNVIGLFDSEEVTKKACMSIVTDSRGVRDIKDPATCNIFALHKLFSKDMLRELSEKYRTGAISYKESKEILAENINTSLAPIRKRKTRLDADPAYVLSVLEMGKHKAGARAQAKMAAVRKLCGFNPHA